MDDLKEFIQSMLSIVTLYGPGETGEGLTLHGTVVVFFAGRCHCTGRRRSGYAEACGPDQGIRVGV